ncbi:unnamed protein product [Prorocentrum cordatum]|uniref:DNA topoisomerase n=1 Tax=Prorocentrum cordatum TaxID=2364126 RepID=A0ABN9U0D1_9DINO|nr:unnamed protein product [Polarella glacialis]
MKRGSWELPAPGSGPVSDGGGGGERAAKEPRRGTLGAAIQLEEKKGGLGSTTQLVLKLLEQLGARVRELENEVFDTLTMSKASPIVEQGQSVLKQYAAAVKGGPNHKRGPPHLHAGMAMLAALVGKAMQSKGAARENDRKDVADEAHASTWLIRCVRTAPQKASSILVVSWSLSCMALISVVNRPDGVNELRKADAKKEPSAEPAAREGWRQGAMLQAGLVAQAVYKLDQSVRIPGARGGRGAAELVTLRLRRRLESSAQPLPSRSAAAVSNACRPATVAAALAAPAAPLTLILIAWASIALKQNAMKEAFGRKYGHHSNPAITWAVIATQQTSMQAYGRMYGRHIAALRDPPGGVKCHDVRALPVLLILALLGAAAKISACSELSAPCVVPHGHLDDRLHTHALLLDALGLLGDRSHVQVLLRHLLDAQRLVLGALGLGERLSVPVALDRSAPAASACFSSAAPAYQAAKAPTLAVRACGLRWRWTARRDYGRDGEREVEGEAGQGHLLKQVLTDTGVGALPLEEKFVCIVSFYGSLGGLGAAGAAQRRQGALREALLKLSAEASAGHRDREQEVDVSRFWFKSEQEQLQAEREHAEQAFSSHVIEDDGDSPAPPFGGTVEPAPGDEAGIENPPEDEVATLGGQAAAAGQPEAAAASPAARAVAAEPPRAPGGSEGIAGLARDAAGAARESGSAASVDGGHTQRAASLTHVMPRLQDAVEKPPPMLKPVVAEAPLSDDCALSMWSEWSDCQQLHDGYKVWFAVRTRVVISGERDGDGVPCPVSQPGGLLQQRACVRANSRRAQRGPSAAVLLLLGRPAPEIVEPVLARWLVQKGELFVDKEGIPHWDGENIALLREYRMRVMIEYSTQSSSTEAGKEKRANLGLRLTRGLTGRAWKAVEPLLDDMASLTQDGSHQKIIEALDGLDKVAVVRKQQKFDDFFKRSRRRRGQEIVEYLRTFHNKYKELTELDTGTKLSDDLYAYFLLEGAMLTDDQKRLVTMVADNKYETKAFENTLKTNYHDLHLQEKTSRLPQPHPHGRSKGGGKGGKDKSKKQTRVYYTEVRDLQRKRGFFKAEGTLTFEEREAEIAKDKQRTHCGACGKIGHWAGDPECPMGPKRPKPSAKPKSRADPRGRAAALGRPAWSSPSASGSSPRPTSSTSAKKRRDATLFVLDDVEYDSAFFVSSDRGSDIGSFKLVGSDIGDSASVVSDGLSTTLPTMKDDEVLPCPKCSKALVARQNHRTGGWFFGCSQFPSCKGTLNYNEGEQRLREARPPPSSA